MRVWVLGVSVMAVACLDPYEAARERKFGQLSGCSGPLGTADSVEVPTSPLVSPLVVCPSVDGGVPYPAGYVLIKGLGRESVYGDWHDAWVPNVVPEPGDCPGWSGDYGASRAFWNEVHVSMREQLLVTNGRGGGDRCEGEPSSPDLMGLSLIDWADLAPTVAIVQRAMLKHDVCSPIIVEVKGLSCGVFGLGPNPP